MPATKKPLDGPSPVPGSWLAATLQGQLEDFGPVTDLTLICFNGKTNPTPPADSAEGAWQTGFFHEGDAPRGGWIAAYAVMTEVVDLGRWSSVDLRPGIL